MKGLKNASQFYYILKGLLLNKVINEKCKFENSRIYFREYDYTKPKPGQEKERRAEFKPWK